ncbi:MULTISPECIES: DUF58 domain-containing protein [Ferrimonas]|uniref:DUF58 domain-containing protein n=1 Tax=Ferrimonas TaxID=44011 RepID=UPI00040E6FD6|nr:MULTISPECIES: DUF58 domain-containing protein [Ferrimonas]USD38822.1 DUF58 domain-containing protein [Ferrimonas sp. SCSIO 43195]
MTLSFWRRPPLQACPQRTLSHNDILIVPTRFGVLFLALSLVLFLFGSNYQNNLILMLAFLMFSLFSSCLLICYRNLAGVTLRPQPASGVHAGDPVHFPINLSGSGHNYHLQLRFVQGDKQQLHALSATPSRLDVPWPSSQRGPLTPPPLIISSRYPLGLCRVWSRLTLNQTAWIWPRPLTEGTPAPPQSRPNQGEDRQSTGDEFEGLKPWQRGHSLSRVAWKQLAQQRGMLIKQFDGPSPNPQLLTVDSQHPQLEQHLSELTGRLQQLHQQGIPVGLSTPTETLMPKLGRSHLHHCLTLLARVEPHDP